MRHEEIQDLLGAYALGALDLEERRAVERHLDSGCAECQGVAHEYQAVAGLLVVLLPPCLEQGARSTEPYAPSSLRPAHLVKRRLLRRIEQSMSVWRIVPVPNAFTQWLGWAAALAASIALVVVVRQNVGLRKTVEEQATQLAQLQGQLADLRSVFIALRDPEMHLTVLTGLEKAPEAKARMLWNPRRQVGYFSAYNLPALPANRIYQLWVIASGRPIGAGIFPVDEQGYGEVRASPAAYVDTVQMFAVTIEPGGGRDTPTLDQMVLRGGY